MHKFLLFSSIISSCLLPSKKVFSQVPGSLDTTFNGTGKLTIQNSNCIGRALKPVAIDNLDRVYVLTIAEQNSSVGFFLRRYLEDGAIDNSFGNGGVFETLGGGVSAPLGLTRGSNGIITVWTIKHTSGNNYCFAIAQYDSLGGIVNSFGDNGIKIICLENLTTLQVPGPRALFATPDGKIILAGNYRDYYFNDSLLMFRLNPNGDFDSSFATNGIYLKSLGYDSYLRFAQMDNSGNIFLSTTYHDAWDRDAFKIWKFDSNGNPDQTFGTNGISAFGTLNLGLYPFRNLQNRSMLLEADGSLLLYANPDFHYTDNYGNGIDTATRELWKLTTIGVFDNTYAINGRSNITNQSAFIEMVIQPDNMLIGYVSDEHNLSIKRMNEPGDSDLSFGNSGTTTVDFTDSVKLFKDLWITDDQKIVTVCALSNQSSIEDSKLGITRLNTSFSTGIIADPIGNQLLQLFPNPVSGKFTLRFELSNSQEVKVELENLTGPVMTLNIGLLNSGQHSITIRIPETLSDGVYFCKIISGQESLAKKFIVMR